MQCGGGVGGEGTDHCFLFLSGLELSCEVFQRKLIHFKPIQRVIKRWSSIRDPVNN